MLQLSLWIVALRAADSKQISNKNFSRGNRMGRKQEAGGGSVAINIENANNKTGYLRMGISRQSLKRYSL
jgi:hypothetical protein